MNVLVVDDNRTNRKLCRVILAGEGHRVREAADGAEALTALADDPPDLILMDVQMPGLDGMATLARLRDDPRSRRIPVVALTAYAMKGDRERFLAAGCVDYLAKPIDIDQLLEAVRRLGGGKGGR
jgi:CheY-like chemotaxis protein